MKIAPEYAPWLELAVVLTIASVVIAVVARLAERWSISAVWRRTVWQVASAAMALLLLVELTGLGRMPAQWLQGGRTGEDQAVCGVATKEIDVRGNDALPLGDEPPIPSREETRPDVALPVVDLDRSFGGADSSWVMDDSSWESPQTVRIAPAVDAEIAPALSVVTPARTNLPEIPAESLVSVCAAPAAWPAVVWLSGSVTIGIYLIIGYLVAAAFHRQTMLLTDAALQQRVDRLAARLAVGKRVRLIESGRLTTPAALGLLRPTIVVPSGFSQDFAQDEQDAILAHELAHLAAGDPAWHLAMNLLTAMLWWQPTVWFLRKRLHFASETAADEATLIVPAGPEHLAASLIAMGRRLIERPRLGWLPMTGDGYRSNLGRRVTRLLNLEATAWGKPPRQVAVWLRNGLVCVLVLTIVFGSAWFRPPAALAEGELTMTKFKISWSRSLAAAAVAAVFSPLAGNAPADDGLTEAPAEMLAAVMQEPEEGHQRVIVIREEEEREEAERHEREGDREQAEHHEHEEDREQAERHEHEGDREQAEHHEHEEDREQAERREREGDREAMEREGMGYRERVIHELEQRRAGLMERAEHLKRELADVPEGGAPELRRALEETLHAAHRTAQELEEVRHGERPRPDGEGREHPEEVMRALMREREELMEIGRRLQRELEELKQAGKEDAAHRVMRELENVKREFEQLEARAKEMHGRVARPDQPRPDAPPREEIERRMHHLHAAAENLHAAGLHEQAEQLMQQAERLAHGGAVPPREQPGPREMPSHQAAGPVQDLQRQVQEMRGQMEEMQRALRMLLERR